MPWQARLYFQYFSDERPPFGRFRLELLGPCCGEKLGLHVSPAEARNLSRTMIRESATLSCMTCVNRYSFPRPVRASSDYVSTKTPTTLDAMKETIAGWIEVTAEIDSLQAFVTADHFMDRIQQCVANPPSQSASDVLTLELPPG